MQNIARDSENSSEEEFFDAHGQHPSPAGGGGALSSAYRPMTQSLVPSEGFSDSDEVFQGDDQVELQRLHRRLCLPHGG